MTLETDGPSPLHESRWPQLRLRGLARPSEIEIAQFEGTLNALERRYPFLPIG